MNRRRFLRATLATTAVLGCGASAVWLSIDKGSQELTVSAALKTLEELSQLSSNQLTFIGDWEPAQIFSHCAQSIDYSLTGFPIHKSSFFKNTAGRLAYTAFAAKGKMTHSLNEPIPGEPKFDCQQDVHMAIQRLHQSFTEFEEYKAALHPHFAYGELTKAEYEQAHVMHFYNHLREFQATI
jgi:hypothetical protein